MYIKEIKLLNYRSFVHQSELRLSPKVNLLVGSNNSGKSSIIRSIYSFQNPRLIKDSDIRLGFSRAHVALSLADVEKGKFQLDLYSKGREGELRNVVGMTLDINSQNGYFFQSINKTNTEALRLLPFSEIEPNNFIYPFLSKRKVESYNEVINIQNARSLQSNLENIYSRVDNLLSGTRDENEEFKMYCKDILGFEIGSFASGRGKQTGISINSFEHIPIDLMGEGISNILQLLSYLVNDLHPRALKALLEIIREKSSQNQFIISTHSNIVLRYLGSAEDSRIFRLDVNVEDSIPTTNVSEIPSGNIDLRRQLLEELGYELADFDLAKYWLIFEESTAERLFKDYLIPWFNPKLISGLQTLSANGAQNVYNRFQEIQRIFLYLHLMRNYKNKIKVFVDGDPTGKNAVEKLRETYAQSDWDSDSFICFQEECLEKYYPARFNEEVSAALALPKDKRRDAKKKIFMQLLDWIEADPSAAKAEFQVSARELIGYIQSINVA